MIIVKKDVRYWVRNANCIGAQCLVLGRFALIAFRTAVASVAAESPTCLTNDYNGCPAKVDYLTDLAAKRRKNGLKLQDS